jgi:hypothetical protein
MFINLFLCVSISFCFCHPFYSHDQLATKVNGKHTADIAMDQQMWKSQAEKREREITQIVSEKLALRKRLDELQAQVCIPLHLTFYANYLFSHHYLLSFRAGQKTSYAIILPTYP